MNTYEQLKAENDRLKSQLESIKNESSRIEVSDSLQHLFEQPSC